MLAVGMVDLEEGDGLEDYDVENIKHGREQSFP